jgi:hypothetical protein
LVPGESVRGHLLGTNITLFLKTKP